MSQGWPSSWWEERPINSTPTGACEIGSQAQFSRHKHTSMNQDAQQAAGRPSNSAARTLSRHTTTTAEAVVGDPVPLWLACWEKQGEQTASKSAA